MSQRAIDYALKHPKTDELVQSDLQAKIANYNSKCRPVVDVDANGFGQGMPRTHAYLPIGERCYDERYNPAPPKISMLQPPCLFVS